MTGTLFSKFKSRFPADQSKVFLKSENDLTFQDLDLRTGQIANTLARRGAMPGARVVVQIEKNSDAVLIYLACLRTGATYVPLNTAYSGEELDFFLQDSDPVLFITASERDTILTEASESDPSFSEPEELGDHPAAMLYSSGTTGRPKGVMLSTEALWSNAKALQQAWQMTPDDVLLHALPLFHTHGLFVAINTMLTSSASIRLLNTFSPGAVTAALPGATVFMGVPTFYARLLSSENFDATSAAHIRLFISGSAPLSQETYDEVYRRTGRRIIERYGMTEAGIITAVRPDTGKAAGVVGQPLEGVQLRISDPGDDGIGGIEIQSPGLFSGYWNLPEKTAEDFSSDGWFKTGDLGHVDQDNSLHITGRAKELIISGGYNVYPKEVEGVINREAGVQESAVVGMPHPDFGEAGLAVVVGDVDADDLRQALKSKLANYKVPKLIVTADQLPRNAMGKVQKTLLQTTYGDAWKRQLES